MMIQYLLSGQSARQSKESIEETKGTISLVGSSLSDGGGGGIRVGKALLNAPGHSGPRPAVLAPVGIAVAVDEARVGVRFGHRAGSPSESGRATTGAL